MDKQLTRWGLFVFLTATNLLFSGALRPQTGVSEKNICFKDSTVTDFTRWTLTEQSDVLPMNIFPAFIGSGYIGVGLDASGMQVLDCRISQLEKYRKPAHNHTDDLYVFHERMISDHLTAKNLMPLGFLHYELEIDQIPIAQLQTDVIGWRRTVDLKKASVETHLVLKQGVGLTITAFMPHESSCIYFRFTTQSTDGQSHTVKIVPSLRLHLRERSGFPEKPIFEQIEHSVHSERFASLTGIVNPSDKSSPLEHYSVLYGVGAFPAGQSAISDRSIGRRLEMRANAESQNCDILFYIGSSAIGRANTENMLSAFEEFESKGFDRIFENHKANYADYYQTAAQLFLEDAKRELLFNNSLYLFRNGCSFQNGIPLQLLLFHPEPWFGSTFWDTVFAIDGLLLSNDLQSPQRTVEFLSKAVKPDGRPFPWIVRYDGSSAVPSDWVDSGYLVNLSHATTAIKYYEVTKDNACLEKTVFPLLQRVADYIVSERLIAEDDHYIGAASGHDVNADLHLNETYTTLWGAVILRKTAEYAQLLNLCPEKRDEWLRISRRIRLDKGENGYYQSRTAQKPGNWVSMLLYPTEGYPFVDLNIFKVNRERQCFLNDYAELGQHQPWVYFWQACSDMRMGQERAERVEELIREGIEFVYGVGYFSEIAPLRINTLTGMPPYISAHGAYLAASTQQWVRGSIWDNTIELFADISRERRQRTIRFERIRTYQGVLVSAEYTPNFIKAVFEGSGDYVLKVAVPHCLNSEKANCIINGKKTSDFQIQNNKLIVPLSLTLNKPVCMEIREI